jgi:hypothetical protein
LLSIEENCKNKEKRRERDGWSYSSNQYEVLYAFRILKKLRENECRPSWGGGGVGGETWGRRSI